MPTEEDGTTFNDVVNGLRGQIQGAFEQVKSFKAEHNALPVVVNEDRGEVMANVTLAMRHLEDAKMRLGKAIQAHSGGVSVYDTPAPVEPTQPEEPATGTAEATGPIGPMGCQ